MKVSLREIRNYQTVSNDIPFREWLFSLKDKKARAAIYARIDRLRQGDFGDYKSLGGEINELRIHYGSGFRLYFGELGHTIIILLCGGAKKSQKRDIKRAEEYWQDFKNRNL
ncbi:MAG: type II toxin-antitoxin system RelE/ParE family toxin [Patescibacteria group bacterium]|nr:type II toxin-antitoxin system RelE/ParE family toxin [Patescibacteria group bacterium]